MDYLGQLYRQGIDRVNGGVFGVISVLFRKVGFPNAITFALFIILFIIFAIKAIDYDIAAGNQQCALYDALNSDVSFGSYFKIGCYVSVNLNASVEINITGRNVNILNLQNI